MAILLAQIGEKTKPFFYLPAMLGIEKENLYLSVEQFAEIMSFVKAEADETRAQSPYLCRAIMNEMRHSFGTALLNSSNNTWIVQIALGHTKAETSQIYARTLNEKIKTDMNNLHNYLWSKCEKENVNQSLVDAVH